MTVEPPDPAPHRGTPDCLWHVGMPAVGKALYLPSERLVR